MEEKEGSDNETKPNIVDNPSCPNSAAEDDGQEEEDKNIKENLERRYQSMKRCTLDSCGSDEQSSICYPMAVVEKKKHKDIFKKHCKMMVVAVGESLPSGGCQRCLSVSVFLSIGIQNFKKKC